jgi:protein-L-isoaspartate(D-aspartate) O-methyltransferase
MQLPAETHVAIVDGERFLLMRNRGTLAKPTLELVAGPTVEATNKSASVLGPHILGTIHAAWATLLGKARTMASYSPQDQMIERQIKSRGIRDPDLLQAMRDVPREIFVPEDLREFAYDDTALPIAEGQTISQPYIVAIMIEAAGVEPGDKVLEVGAGSGYAAAVLSRIAGDVIAIERHKALADAAEVRLAELGYTNVTVIAGDGSGGLPEEAPFDAILVAARGPRLPEALKRQLKAGGRLVIPVGGEDVQSLLCITRNGDEDWSTHVLDRVRFVPLIGAHGVSEDGTRAASDHRAPGDKSLPS